MDYNDFKEYGLAERAVMAYTERCREARVTVRLHRSMGIVQKAVLTVAMVAMVVGIAWLARPEVYGYVNGKPIYSLAEAELQAEQIMANLAQGGGAQQQENLLQSLFMIE